MNRTALAALAVLGLALSGCAADGGGDGGSGTVSDPGGPGPAPALATGVDDVVLRIETGGGYVPVDYAFANAPRVLVTGDGTVLEPAPQAADAGPRRLLTLEQHHVDAATLDDLARLAEDAGLLAEPPDYSRDAPMVTDMPSTTVTITADGETWTHSAYALGFEDEQGKRANLAEFVDDAIDLLDDGDTEPYAPQRLRLSASEVPGGGEETATVAWPAGALDLAGIGSCTVVDDPRMASVVADTLSGAAPEAVFQQDGRAWSVAAAVVLPGDDQPCADW